MTFRAWKIWILNFTTFQDLYAPCKHNCTAHLLDIHTSDSQCGTWHTLHTRLIEGSTIQPKQLSRRRSVKSDRFLVPHLGTTFRSRFERGVVCHVLQTIYIQPTSSTRHQVQYAHHQGHHFSIANFAKFRGAIYVFWRRIIPKYPTFCGQWAFVLTDNTSKVLCENTLHLKSPKNLDLDINVAKNEQFCVFPWQTANSVVRCEIRMTWTTAGHAHHNIEYLQPLYATMCLKWQCYTVSQNSLCAVKCQLK